MNIFQWNSQSLRPISISELLLQENIHIAAISETWFDSELDVNISDFNVYRKDRDDSYGGVAILVQCGQFNLIRFHLIQIIGALK